MEKKTKNIVLVCLGLALILLIALLVMFFIKNSNKNDIVNNTTTTTTTQKTDLVLENSGVKLTVINGDLKNDTKLHIDTVDVTLKDLNVLSVYDITLKDIEGNVIKISDANIKIEIPYENKDKYTKFTILYLNDTNEVLETYSANYLDGKVAFNVNHLSRYAIVGEKEEKTTTTTGKKTAKKTTTAAKITTTAKPTTTTTTTKSTTKTTTTTTKSTTKTTTTTTKSTTTKKVVTYSYEWSKEGDQAGKYYLYVVDNSGNKVAGTVTLTSKATGSSKTFEIPASGRLFVKDNYTVSNAKGN